MEPPLLNKGHPQNIGKLERLHRTMKAELLQGRRFAGFEAAQIGLDSWRRHDNQECPREVLDGDAPSSRYLMSQRAPSRFWGPATLPECISLDDDRVGRIRKKPPPAFGGEREVSVGAGAAAAATGSDVLA